MGRPDTVVERVGILQPRSEEDSMTDPDREIDELRRRADEVREEVDDLEEDLEEPGAEGTTSLTETEGQPYHESGTVDPHLDDQAIAP
jgi:hypothetical protein